MRFLSSTNADLAANNAATTDQLADAISSGSINIAKGGEIVFFGCNNDAIASHLSYNLTERGRGDIRVTGATGSVSPTRGERSATTNRGYSFNTYQNASYVSSTRTRSYR
jgi:hypothetical protein